MFKLVDALFGCSHKHSTFPRTAARPGQPHSEAAANAVTYIVCLDCGKEFAYDWERMKVVASGEKAPNAAA